MIDGFVVSPEAHHALPYLGSGDVNSFIRGGPKALERRLWLKLKDIAAKEGLEPTAAWALRDELAERSRFQSSRAMRAGAMLEAYLFGNGEEADWAERCASAAEIDGAREEAAFVVRHRPSFPTTGDLVEIQSNRYANLETQVTEIAELRGVWVKCRADFIWKDAANVNVEADMKRWANPRRPWHNDEDVLDLASDWGALTQRALYRLILEAARGGEWRSAILAIDPTRAEPLDLLVEIPDHLMKATISQVEDALDQIAAMTRVEAA